LRRKYSRCSSFMNGSRSVGLYPGGRSTIVRFTRGLGTWIRLRIEGGTSSSGSGAVIGAFKSFAILPAVVGTDLASGAVSPEFFRLCDGDAAAALDASAGFFATALLCLVEAEADLSGAGAGAFFADATAAFAGALGGAEAGFCCFAFNALAGT
jgi:hypothetical protein